MASRKSSSAAAIAQELVEGRNSQDFAHYVATVAEPGATAATANLSARVIEEVVTLDPQLGAPHIRTLVQLLNDERPRVAQAGAQALPLITKVAPAKVARQMPVLQDRFDQAQPVQRDAIVRIFVALCLASVAYQKRVIGVLVRALEQADPKTLVQWAALALPALKGEPHAQARAVVETRLPALPRPLAKKLADALGIKLRPQPR